MDAHRWIRRLSLALCVICVLAVAGTAVALRRTASDTSGASGYRVGDRIDLPAEWFAGAASTTVVFMRSDCSASQALAERLAEGRPRIASGARVLAVVPGTSTQEIDFAVEAGFDRAAVRTAEFQQMKLRVVPAVVTVDAAGTVTREALALAGADGQIAIDAFLPSS
ncbi:MAG: hypothetical protein ABS36_05805 [Acidobacteria bacterium SCN 69-37]|nr:MAG: hypothetical protein ABS36_05805 [Acidobacteria bacterium SCN 69-37]